MDARIKEDDGAFWMSFDDFVLHFHSFNVCMASVPLGTGMGQGQGQGQGQGVGDGESSRFKAR